MYTQAGTPLNDVWQDGEKYANTGADVLNAAGDISRAFAGDGATAYVPAGANSIPVDYEFGAGGSVNVGNQQKGTNWVPWAVGGAVVLGGVYLATRKKKK